MIHKTTKKRTNPIDTNIKSVSTGATKHVLKIL